MNPVFSIYTKYFIVPLWGNVLSHSCVRFSFSSMMLFVLSRFSCAVRPPMPQRQANKATADVLNECLILFPMLEVTG